jgi:histone-lysine N-methyltransferase SETMAR
MPKELTEAQKRKRVEVATELQNRARESSFFDRIVTSDEKWISFVNENRHGEWRSPGQKPCRTPRNDFRAKKAMLCVWWDRRGPIFWELLEQGKTVDSDVYCEQLENTRRALRNRRIPVIFLDDNARPHRSIQTREKIEEFGWEPLDHAPYSPDMAPSDFYLFRSLEHWLRGKKFKTVEEMRESLTEFFASKDREWYRRGIYRLEEQWQKVVESNGEYFDY